MTHTHTHTTQTSLVIKSWLLYDAHLSKSSGSLYHWHKPETMQCLKCLCHWRWSIGYWCAKTDYIVVIAYYLLHALCSLLCHYSLMIYFLLQMLCNKILTVLPSNNKIFEVDVNRDHQLLGLFLDPLHTTLDNTITMLLSSSEYMKCSDCNRDCHAWSEELRTELGNSELHDTLPVSSASKFEQWL